MLVSRDQSKSSVFPAKCGDFCGCPMLASGQNAKVLTAADAMNIASVADKDGRCR
jgi:hypothetical protein